MVIADLNTITSTDEKRGGKLVRLSKCCAYLNFVNNSSLIDFGFFGPIFIYDNGHIRAGNIQEHLDRVLANPTWLQVYPHTQVTHLPWLYSDHSPILVNLQPVYNPTTPPFRGLVA